MTAVDKGLLTADTVLGRGTTVIDTEDGSLRDYLESLHRLQGLGTRTVLPGHGPDLPDLHAVTAMYLAHREERLDQVRAALRNSERTPGPAQVVEHVYTDVDQKLWDAAEKSVQAQLDSTLARSDTKLPFPVKGSFLFCSAETSGRAVASRSLSQISTLLPSSRIQPRWAKSASALLTVSRDAPTSWAISSCVRSCVTRSAPPSCVPNRWASCSSCLATPTGDVGEDQVGQVVVGAAQTAREHAQQLLGDLRAVGDPRAQRVTVHRHRAHLGDGGGARGTGPRVEDRQLAEHVRRTHDGQQVLATVRRTAADLHLAGNDDVQAVAGLALGEDRMPAREVDGLQLLRQRRYGGRFDALEDSGPGQDLVHVAP